MEETIIRGLVIGLTFAAIGFALNMAWKLMRSDSETARRTRQVLGAGIALLIVIGFITGGTEGRTFLAVLVFIIGAGIWIARGKN